MIAAQHADLLDEYGWMLGDDADHASLSPAAKKAGETRIAAMLFKRRLRLVLYWRKLGRNRSPKHDEPPSVTPPPTLRSIDGGFAIICNMPKHLPPFREEIAILRALLGQEIDAILFGND